MSLNVALKDQARVITKLPSTRKVEGKTVMVDDITGDWFKARLGTASSRESGDGGNTWKTTKSPQLLFGVKDTMGNTLIDVDKGCCVLRASDRVEVNSPQMGRAIYELSGDPEPIRKKRRVIGFEATIVKVDRQQFETYD